MQKIFIGCLLWARFSARCSGYDHKGNFLTYRVGGLDNVSLPVATKSTGSRDRDSRYVSPGSAAVTHQQQVVMSTESTPTCHKHLSPLPLMLGPHDQGVNSILPGPAEL